MAAAVFFLFLGEHEIFSHRQAFFHFNGHKPIPYPKLMIAFLPVLLTVNSRSFHGIFDQTTS